MDENITIMNTEINNVEEYQPTEQEMDDMNTVSEMLEDVAKNSEEVNTIREIVDSEHTEVLEDEEATVDLTIDNTTGAVVNVREVEEGIEVAEEEYKISEASLLELAENHTPTELPVLEDELTETFKNDMNLSDDDTAQMLIVINRYKNGEKFSVYNALPDSVKSIVKKAGVELGLVNRDQLAFFAKTMLDSFIQDANFNREIVEFETSLKNELNIPSLLDLHAEYTRDAMEKELLEKADKLDEQGYPDKAAALRRVSAAFTSSYTYDKVYETLETNRKVRSRLAKDISKYKRFCDDFSYKYRDTKFNIHDIALCFNILKRAFPGRTDDEVIMFVNTIWKSMENLDTEVLENNIYAYYVIKNIMTLDYTDQDASTDFTKEIIKNIDEVMDKINEYVAAKAEADAAIEADRKSKKGGKKK